MEELQTTETTEEVTDNSQTVEEHEPLQDDDNSEQQGKEPETTEEKEEKTEDEPQSKFSTLEDANKGYSELEKKLGQQSNELGELRKAAQRAKELEEQLANAQLQEAQSNGFDSVQAYQYSREIANNTANEYAKHIKETEFPGETANLIEEYRKKPSSELLETIEAQFPLETIKKVAAANTLYAGQLEVQRAQALQNEIETSAKNYLDIWVPKYEDRFHNKAFADLYGEAFKAIGCDLDTDKFIALVDNYTNSVLKANGIKKSIAKNNAEETDEIAALTPGKNAETSGNGKSLLDMSDKELDKRLSELI